MIIQNIDRIIRPKDYQQFGKEILVTSYFNTIQGEGPFAGHPAVFLRLAGCNFGNKSPTGACQFCDTAFQFDKGQRFAVEDLGLLLDLIKEKSKLLVITGGEPTLQINLLDLIKRVYPLFHKVQIETNGTQAFFFSEMEKQGITEYRRHNSPFVSVVVSPKANYKANRYAPLSDTVLKHATCLKFVIESNPDSPHHTIPDWALDCNLPVYVSPMAIYQREYQGEVSSIWEEGLIDKEATSRNYAYAAEYAMEHGLLLSLQTHLFLGVA